MKRFLKDRRGIEGLPMKLIIIVVIAGAVLAAVLAMINTINPKGDLNLMYRDGTSFHDCEISGMARESVGAFNVNVTIRDQDSGEVVSGATVTITGYGGGGSNTTGSEGQTTITVSGVEIPQNVDQIKLDVEATAPDYHKLTLEDSVVVSR